MDPMWDMIIIIYIYAFTIPFIILEQHPFSACNVGSSWWEPVPYCRPPGVIPDIVPRFLHMFVLFEDVANRSEMLCFE